MPKRLLFVCAGNICRSPMAEGMFRYLAAAQGRAGDYVLDSAGTGAWHEGEAPDARMSETARRYGVRLAGRARRFREADFDRFDLIFAMDRANQAHLLRAARSEADRQKVRLLREFDPEARGDLDVPDPYYGGRDGFEEVYRIVERSSRTLLETLEEEEVGRPTNRR